MVKMVNFMIYIYTHTYCHNFFFKSFHLINKKKCIFRVHIESGGLRAFLCVPRMGCPQFGECEFSVYTGSLPSLEESSEQLNDTVTFLLGGSFSLGEVWEDMGLPAYKVGTGP